MFHCSLGFVAGHQNPVVAGDVRNDVERWGSTGVKTGGAQRGDAHRTDGEWNYRDLDQFVRVLRSAASTEQTIHCFSDCHISSVRFG